MPNQTKILHHPPLSETPMTTSPRADWVLCCKWRRRRTSDGGGHDLQPAARNRRPMPWIEQPPSPAGPDGHSRAIPLGLHYLRRPPPLTARRAAAQTDPCRSSPSWLIPPAVVGAVPSPPQHLTRCGHRSQLDHCLCSISLQYQSSE